MTKLTTNILFYSITGRGKTFEPNIFALAKCLNGHTRQTNCLRKMCWIPAQQNYVFSYSPLTQCKAVRHEVSKSSKTLYIYSFKYNSVNRSAEPINKKFSVNLLVLNPLFYIVFLLWGSKFSQNEACLANRGRFCLQFQG